MLPLTSVGRWLALQLLAGALAAACGAPAGKPPAPPPTRRVPARATPVASKPLLTVGSAFSHQTGFYQTKILAARFTPDGRQLLTADDKGRVARWDAGTQALLRSFSVVRRTGSPAADEAWHLLSATFSPDGRRVLEVRSSSAALWDVATGKRRFVIPAKTRAVHPERVAFSPTGPVVVYSKSGEDNVILQLDEAGRELRSTDLRALGIHGRWLDLFEGGEHALVDRGARHVLVLATGQLVSALPFHGHAAVAAAAGRLVALSVERKELFLHDAKSGKRLAPPAKLDCVLNAHAISPAGDAVAFACYGELYRWDLAPGAPAPNPRKIATDPETINALGFSPDGRTLVTGNVYGMLRLLDARSGREVARAPQLGSVQRLAFTADGAQLVSAHAVEPFSDRPRAKVRWWDAATGAPRGSLVLDAAAVVDELWLAPGDDRGYVLVAREPRTEVHVVDLKARQIVRRFRVGDYARWLRPSGARRVVTYEGRAASVWSAATGKLVGPFAVRQGRRSRLVISARGDLIAEAGPLPRRGASHPYHPPPMARRYGYVDWYDARGKKLGGYGKQGCPFGEVAVSADACWVAASGHCGAALLRACGLGLGGARWLTRQRDAEVLALSPDGAEAAVLLPVELQLAFFDTRAGRKLRVIDYGALLDTPTAVAYAPDGRRVAVGGRGGAVRVFARGRR